MFKLIKQGNYYNDQIPYYVCDKNSDLDSIPLSKEIKDNIGDRAYVINESNQYVRNSEGEWQVDLSIKTNLPEGAVVDAEVEIGSF